MKLARRLLAPASVLSLLLLLALDSAGVSASGGSFTITWSPSNPTAGSEVTLTTEIQGCGAGNTSVPSLYYYVTNGTYTYNLYYTGVTLENDGDAAVGTTEIGPVPAGTYDVYAYGRGTPCFASGYNFTDSSVTQMTVSSSGPSAPTELSAAAETNGNVQLSWDASTDSGTTITGYTVAPDPSCSGCTGLRVTGDPAAVTTTIAGLTLGQVYTFTATASDSNGTSASSSASSQVIPSTVPGQPVAVTALAGPGSVQLVWSDPSDNGATITSYTVSPDPACSGCTGLSVTGDPGAVSTTVDGLAPGQPYTFTVAATNLAGQGPESAPSNQVTPEGDPGLVTEVNATAGISSATVTWSAATDNGSQITQYTVLSIPDALSCTWTAGPLQCTVTGLVNGVTYVFAVYATNGLGDGPLSSLSNPVIPTDVPDQVTGVSAVGGDGSATVSWAEPGDNGSPITEYTVTASPGGATCTWTSGPLVCTVTGLTDGDTYTFTVSASNGVGSGPDSAPSNQVTPNVAQLLLDAGGGPQGGSYLIEGTGLLPGSSVTITLHSSSPELLSTTTVPTNGDVSITVSIPAGTAAGSHTLVAQGEAPDGTSVSGTLAITVARDPGVATPDTGSGLLGGGTAGPGIALVLAGLLLLGMGLVRRPWQRRVGITS